MELHKKKPIIIERKMRTWKAKGKKHERMKEIKESFFVTVGRGVGILGGKIVSGVKKLSTEETAQKLGDWGRSAGEFASTRGYSHETSPEKRKTKSKKR